MTKEALTLALDGITKIPTLTHGVLVKLSDIESAIKKALSSPNGEVQPEPTNLERHERNVQQLFGTPQPKEPEQEPVAWPFEEQPDGSVIPIDPSEMTAEQLQRYITPPQRKPLTDEEIAEFAERMEASDPTDSFWREFARAIEAAHGIKEKNT